MVRDELSWKRVPAAPEGVGACQSLGVGCFHGWLCGGAWPGHQRGLGQGGEQNHVFLSESFYTPLLPFGLQHPAPRSFYPDS